MIMRFTSNRNNIFLKMSCVILALMLSVTALCRIIEIVSGEKNPVSLVREKVSSVAGDAVSDFYYYIVGNEYKIAAYNEARVDENNPDKSKASVIMDVINSESSLYRYVYSREKNITYANVDPSYRYGDVKGAETMEISSSVIEEKNQEKSEDKEDDGKEEKATVGNQAVAANGITYTMEQLSDFDFLMSNLYTVPDRALVYESDLVAEEMLAKDMTMVGDNSKPQILIYHTHSQEGFADSAEGDDTTNIVAVGAYLAQLLSEKYGYNVIHCREHFDIAGGTLDRSKAYTYAQYTIEQILEDNPSIEVILDIHRDGLPEGADKLVTNINGKDTAKIMFFNGVSRSSAAGDIDYLYNRYRADNLAFSFQLKLAAMEYYPDFTRRNYIDAYQYNLHHRQKSVLVEVGAQNNTLQEELNAMEVLADVLNRVLSPK